MSTSVGQFDTVCGIFSELNGFLEILLLTSLFILGNAAALSDVVVPFPNILFRPDSVRRLYYTSSAPFSVNLRSRGTTNRRASTGDSTFAVAGPRTRNSLPPALLSASKSFSTFEKT